MKKKAIIPISACSLLLSAGLVGVFPNGALTAEKEPIREQILPVERVEMNEIRILVNGEWLEMDVAPYIEKNRTMVPVRALMEHLGAELKWHPEESLVEVYTKDMVIELGIGEETALIRKQEGNETYTLDNPAKIVNGRTFIPGRFVSEALGAKVEWNAYMRAMVVFTDVEQNEVLEVSNLVEQFGQKLQMVSLLAPEDVIKKGIVEHYRSFVTQSLFEKWINDVEQAPGRLASSPWPERIEILNIKESSQDTYEVKGEIIEITSTELENGGVAAKLPIVLTVKKISDHWLIDEVTVDNAIEAINYHNNQYGFCFSLPETWKDYQIVNEDWVGHDNEGKRVQSGPMISIRHPKWTAENPRQDIPIMIFTRAQWQELEEDEFHIGAAPIGPKKLGQNTEYVFALPARYNFSFPTGYEEVEEILKNNPLVPIEK